MRKTPQDTQVNTGKYVQGLADEAAGELELDDVGDFELEAIGGQDAPARGEGGKTAAGNAETSDANAEAPAGNAGRPDGDDEAPIESGEAPGAPGDARDVGDGAGEGGETARTRRRVPRRALAGACIVVAVLAAVYLGGVLYFSSHVFPSTRINGADASLASISELASSRTAQVTDYKASVHGAGVSFAFSGADVELGFDGDAFGAAVAGQVNGWIWPATLFTSRDLQIAEPLTFDSDKLSQIVAAPVDEFNDTAEHPQAAAISYDESKQAFSVAKEVAGTYIDKEAALRAVADAVRALKGDIELGDDVREQPALFSDDTRLPAAVQKANTYAKRKVELVAQGTSVQVVDASLISGWVALDGDASAVVDVESVRKWTQGDLSRACDTIGATRTWTRADGKQCTVSGGTYGWSIDGATLAENLAAAIEEGTSERLDIPMSASAARWQPGGADWTSYIDVDLGEQHARFFDESGSIVWESDIVSGAEKNNRQSPTGVYTINSNMGRDRTLIGSDENGDGKPDYETPVSYWMPFVGDSVAFHDASWRSSFGGTIYKESGSHGCINLPSGKAAALYASVKVGTVVVSHT